MKTYSSNYLKIFHCKYELKYNFTNLLKLEFHIQQLAKTQQTEAKYFLAFFAYCIILYLTFWKNVFPT